MIILLHGNDPYQINHRLETIKSNYPKDCLNVITLPSESSLILFEQEIKTIPFLSNKKLIIVTELSKNKDKSIQISLSSLLETIPPEIDLVFIESDIKSQNWLYKIIQKNGKIESKNALKPYETTAWITNIVNEKNGTIDKDAVTLLFIKLGNDLSRLENEINKLIIYNHHITKEIVSNIVEGDFLESIFSLMDAISERKRYQALKLIREFGIDPNNSGYLISMLSRQIRNLLSIKELNEKGLKESEIAEKLKLHPFVVKNILKQSHNFSTDSLLVIHQDLVDIEYQIKSNQSDPRLLLSQSILRFCQN